MKIWIDADAAPRDVKDIVFRAAVRLDIETILVANQPIASPANAPMVSSVVVRDGANVADQYIVAKSRAGDLAITADIPLAAELVDKGVLVIDPRGDQYTLDNIRSRLAMRDFMDELRGFSDTASTTAAYGEKDKRAFASAFDRSLAKLLKPKRE
ncbi:MAG: YaiI/YqxD family protein [Pirellulaceae bacterium]|nr:YaiI/YqxD family protein [Pirellulaceae bacterium]